MIIIKLKINKYKKQGYLLHTISKNKHCLCKILDEYDTIEVESGEVYKTLKPLINKGLIRQDRRESSEPFESCSTYYTIRARRDEIDQLLWGDAVFDDYQ